MPPPIYLENHRSVRAFYFLFHIPVHRTEQQQHYSVILHHLLRKATEYTQQLTPNTTSVQVSRTLKALGEKGRLIGCLSNCFTFSNLSRQRRHPYAKEIDGGSLEKKRRLGKLQAILMPSTPCLLSTTIHYIVSAAPIAAVSL